MISHGVKIADRKILKLLFNGSDTEAVSYRGIDFYCFKGNLSAPLLGLEHKSSHIMKPVCELDNNNSDIARHGNEHLSDILRLLFFLGLERNLADFCYSVNKLRNRFAEFLSDFLNGELCILNRIVKYGGDY